MSEVPPTTPPPVVPRLEREPVTYERVLETMRALKSAGIKKPLGSEDPRAIEANDLLEEWRLSRGLHMRGIGSVEKASDIIRGALVWIEAGYNSTQDLKNAIEALSDEHADALREGNEGITNMFKSALDALDKQIGQHLFTEKLPAQIVKKLEEAQEAALKGRTVDAVGILTMALFDPRFKRLPPDVLTQIRELRDSYKAAMVSAPRAQ